MVKKGSGQQVVDRTKVADNKWWVDHKHNRDHDHDRDDKTKNDDKNDDDENDDDNVDADAGGKSFWSSMDCHPLTARNTAEIEMSRAQCSSEFQMVARGC